MHYTLYIASAADDRRAAYAWLLVKFDGAIADAVYLTHGERRFDDNYGAHIALQRALRVVARQEGVIQLRVVMDETVANAIGYELLGAAPPLYPTLCQATKRIMRRFADVELASFRRDEADALPQEVAVLDDALDALDRARTINGRLNLWIDAITRRKETII